MSIKFEDNRRIVMDYIDDSILAFLEEAGAEYESQAARNTRVDTKKTKQSWKHIVNKANKSVTIGNTAQNSMWEEWGTGEYAYNGDGRKGGWYIPKDKLDQKTIRKFEKKYHFKKVYGKGKKEYYFTLGKKPQRMLYKAHMSKKNVVMKRLGTILRKGL